MTVHKPVLLSEVIEWLNIKPGNKIIDATLSGGGHVLGILEKYPGISILGIEWDPDIFQEFQGSELASQVIAVNDSYTNLKNIVAEHNFKPDGIIFDLGLSSKHFESGRGFSFRKDEPLDMRFSLKDTQTTAAEIINTWEAEELEKILLEYGEERFAPQIVKEIISTRREKPITTTLELVGVIGQVVPEGYKKRKIHFATKTFQALRIAVNDELGNVKKGIEAAIDVLNPGGRLVVITFQGLEDIIIKQIFKNKVKEGVITLPFKGSIKPKWEEVKENPRARSAKIKVAEKL